MFRKNRIVIVEPSVFRRNDVHVIGPFHPVVAWLLAKWIQTENIYALCNVVPVERRVTQGKRVLWDGIIEP